MKNRSLLILSAILVVLTAVYYFGIVRQSKSSFDPEEAGFAVRDTAGITAIQMDYMLEGKMKRRLILERQGTSWTVNGKYPALQPKIDILLKTLRLVKAREPVLPQARQNMLELLGREHTEVTIQKANGETHSYKVGTNTRDNMGTFMLLRGADDIYITFVPGHKGYLNSRYSSLEDDWRENLVFAAIPEKIEQVSLTYAGGDSSFTLTRKGGNWDLNGKSAGPAAQEYISGFKKIIAESLVDKYYPGKKEELLKLKPDVLFEIRQAGAAPFRMKIWYRTDRKDLYFALPDTTEAGLISLQEFHFGPYLKTRRDLE